MPEILQYEFMVRAIAAAAMLGAVAPAFGVYLVLRRLSLMAETLAHVALTGVAVGLLTRVYPPFVALGATTGTAVAIEQLRVRRLLPGDAALAVFLYGALAVAVVLISVADGFNTALFGYLFGSVLTVSASDLWLVGGLAAGVLLFLGLFHVELAQTSFDPDLARVSGVRVNAINLGLAIVTGATITVSMRVVGVLLVGALIVVPVLVSLRVSTGLTATVLTASLTGMAIAVSGVVLAYYADLAPGGTVVLVAVALLAVVETAAAVRRRTKRSMGATTGA